MGQKKPDKLVSILINNYNYGHFLNEAIDSTLEQTYAPCEVIVVDDGSTDNSREVIMSYGDKVIPIFKENGGQATAFNVGFEASKGEIICFLDADDVFLPEKIEKIVSSLSDKEPKVGWVFHSVELVKSTSVIKTGKPQTTLNTTDTKNSPLEVDVRRKMRGGRLGDPCVIPATSGMCFTRPCLQKILPMPTSKGIVLNDSYIKFVAMALYKGISLKQDLTLQRIHRENLFTLRENNSLQLAEILITTAFFMRKQFPSLEKFSDNLFASGWSLDQSLMAKDGDYACLAKEYLQTSSCRQKLMIRLKRFFYRVKQ